VGLGGCLPGDKISATRPAAPTITKRNGFVFCERRLIEKLTKEYAEIIDMSFAVDISSMAKTALQCTHLSMRRPLQAGKAIKVATASIVVIASNKKTASCEGSGGRRWEG
jgi:hypothetical protein